MLQHEINLLDTAVSQESVSIFIAYMKINLSLQHNEFTVCTFCLYTPTFKYKNTLVMDKQGLALQRAEGRGAFGSPWKSRTWLHTSPWCCLHRAGLSPVTKPSEFGTPQGTRTMSRDEKNMLSLRCWMQGCSRKTQTRQCLLCHGQAETLLQLLSWLGCPPPFLPPPPPHLQFPPQDRHLLPGSGPAVPLDNKIKLLQVPKASNTFQCVGWFITPTASPEPLS